MANKAKFPMSEDLRRWYRKIGARGGQAGKGTEERREIMRKNAHIRWNKWRKAKAAEEAKVEKLLSRPAPPPAVGFK